MYHLAIDGGGSGCRARLADTQGQVLGEGTAGPANIATDRDSARTNILIAAQSALAGRDPARVSACLGLAGANVPEARDWIAARLPFGRVQVLSDLETSLEGALGPGDGILASLGTGSVFAARRGAAVTRIGGWGLRLGDEASGAWLGREFCRAALAAAEGLGPDAPCLAALRARMGGVSGIVTFGATARPADFAALMPDLCNAHDAASMALLARADHEVIRVIDRLQAGAALPVVFTGGLGPFYAERLKGRWPLRAAHGTALEGALRIAARQGAAAA